ncbi:MAG: hypothetical protein KH382_08000 [Clostridiales bacterium]|jgi:hypothetical protein|nr:hypothetical protein [Clostridiales bacterium]DAH17330.1 MAG TPA: hypothetical protein [Caudoviricetes sp.]
MTDAQIKTFLDGFTITKDGDAKRKTLAHYVNIGTEAAPEWELLGYKVEDSSIEYNWEIETVTDIRGVTSSDVQKSEPSQSMDGSVMNKNSEFLQELNRIAIRGAYEELTLFEMMTVYGFMRNEADACLAVREKNCTITPDSIGGSGTVGFPYTINYSNDKTYGTVPEITANPTFTEGTAGA